MGGRAAATITLILCARTGAAQATRVSGYQKISSTLGGFSGPLADEDLFGISVAALGDIDGDGVPDLAVGAQSDDEGGSFQGAVWILFLYPDGTVKGQQKINSVHGGLPGLPAQVLFGRSLGNIGDLDGDGIVDLAVGAPLDIDGGVYRGSIWLLFLNTDGTVKSHQKISSTQGGFTGMLRDGDSFGGSVCRLGDVDGDGVTDLAVGADYDSHPFELVGSVWVLLMNADGTVKTQQKIGVAQGGFTGELEMWQYFGRAVAPVGDMDGDGVPDMAVGAPGNFPFGALWILFLNSNGTVKSHQKIDGVVGGLQGLLETGDAFGWGLAALGDLDGDGHPELASGALGDGAQEGALWILFLDPDGTVRTQRKINETHGGFTGQLDPGDWFGISAAWLGDLDGDGFGDLGVGATFDDDGGPDRGAVWVLFLDKAIPFPRASSGPVLPGGSVMAPFLAGPGSPWGYLGRVAALQERVRKFFGNHRR